MKKITSLILSVLFIEAMTAETATDFSVKDIPLTKVTLYSSGVAHYVHEGNVSDSGNIELLFHSAQINDALKSLVVTDPAAQNIRINYQSEDTLRKTLESLKVDLSASVTLFDILKAQKGAEIELFTPHQMIGKILSVDKKHIQEADEAFFISLAAKDGVHIISLSNIQSFRFTDEKRNEDLNAALALILDASAKNRKKLGIRIDAKGERNIKLSYIMAAPVWKASYRLDMNAGKAAFQAWAIVDNSTDLDWKDITLTLTAGRPIGFRQNLYAPYYTYRPELPLSIAQAAEAETFDSGVAADSASYRERNQASMAKRSMITLAEAPDSPYDDSYAAEPTGPASLEAAAPPAYFDNQAKTGNKGEMFAFTPSTPITLERQQSMMLPLTLATLPAEKCSVFSSIPYGLSVHPKFCINMENASGLKLPAGPITVFDDGEYAGDALLEFLPENEKRLIAYGDDIEVSGTKTDYNGRNIEIVKIADGILSILYKQIQTSVYGINNTDKKERTIIIEHAKRAGFELTATDALTETTANKYRFTLKAAGGSSAELKIEESRTYWNERKIFDMNSDAYISYSTNSDIPDNIKKAFESIIKEKEKVDTEQKALGDLQNRRTETEKEQDRVRKNLEAVGSESQQGKEFLNKLIKLENELDTLNTGITAAAARVSKTKADFITFVKGIKIE